MPYLKNRPTGLIQLSVNVPVEWKAIFNSMEKELYLDINK